GRAHREIVADQRPHGADRQQHLRQRPLVLVADIQDQAALANADPQTVRTRRRAGQAELVLIEQVVDGDGALVLDLSAAADRSVFFKRDLDEAPAVAVHRRHPLPAAPERSETEMPCASSPSSPASVSAAGPIAANASASQPMIDVRFRKSGTPSPDEKRALREVGSTWLGPAT